MLKELDVRGGLKVSGEETHSQQSIFDLRRSVPSAFSPCVCVEESGR